MFQQILALAIIAFFLIRLLWQKKKKKINGSEFIFWLSFWIMATIAIAFIKEVDKIVARLGFDKEGIDILFYIAVLILFYLIFKVRLRQAKIEKEITKIVRDTAIKDKNKNFK